MPLNDELARCWAPMASQFSEEIGESLASQLACAFVQIDVAAPPAIAAIPDPSAGGMLSLRLPADGSSWSMVVAGRINLPDPFGNRTITATLSGLQLSADVNLSPPSGGDPRPRIA